jgi:nitrite reductase/ring-hydroxylating ferredoxin subunit
MQFVKIAKTSDFEGKRFLRFTLLARKVGIFREPDGSFFAVEIACKHQNWDLTTGRIEGDIATCPRHGWKYNIRTGECLTHDSLRLRRYAVKVEGDDVLVSLTPQSEDAPEDSG